MDADQPSRKRDATATKAALLDAAAELFADRGFDRTTVRDIANRAGVNQALLFRYFGSKDALFEHVMARGGLAQVETTPPERLFSAALRSLLERDDPASRSIETYLRSSGTDRADEALRAQLDAEYTRALSGLTDAPDAELRADLAMAWLLGIGLVRSITRKDPLATAPADEIERLIGPAVRTLLERSK
ncbi:helix-turn-helix transcriptional regulator [Amycolatopsis rubida]|uniref:Helix-turn-helix transcriptional regulator n=1 Tax=Amycolatopsis rubida TaxID=112413 RepID=A0A1I5Z8Q6_9PSEU|nr:MULTISPECIES: TetR family transcriptional regulator [Amycolatopsis]MYW89924.1 TetR family transcriptional regulator [Amycolatopsis rubida]NEC54901.1 helix-turn-helix transcriptional regulator [Amycolatopsis rubida]OAP25102.1 HTH-type transcriptional repressor KstR2 [Amycolatopsis sp. M39]SFQ52824.1 transcriptional regulator, TetR family [Amycolatopsis rubida]